MKKISSKIIIGLFLFATLITVGVYSLDMFEQRSQDTVARVDVGMSGDEKTFIQDKVLTVAVTEYPPFFMINEKQNKFDGLVYEILQILSRKTNITFKYKVFKTLDEAVNAVESNSVDMVFNLNSVNDKLQKSEPYFIKRASSIVNRNTHGKFFETTSVPDVSKRKIAAVVSGTGIEKLLAINDPSPNVIFVDTPIDALLSIIIGDADFTFLDTSQFGFYQKKFDSHRLIIAGDGQKIEISSAFGFSPQTDKKTIHIINTALSSLNQNDRAFLNEYWENFIYTPPLMRAEFLLLLMTISLFILVNVAWFLFYTKSIKRFELQMNSKWLSALSETLDVEKKALRLQIEEELKAHKPTHRRKS